MSCCGSVCCPSTGGRDDGVMQALEGCTVSRGGRFDCSGVISMSCGGSAAGCTVARGGGRFLFGGVTNVFPRSSFAHCGRFRFCGVANPCCLAFSSWSLFGGIAPCSTSSFPPCFGLSDCSCFSSSSSSSTPVSVITARLTVSVSPVTCDKDSKILGGP
jgi:hypothetical protein